jgi:hypothetical protein
VDNPVDGFVGAGSPGVESGKGVLKAVDKTSPPPTLSSGYGQVFAPCLINRLSFGLGGLFDRFWACRERVTNGQDFIAAP